MYSAIEINLTLSSSSSSACLELERSGFHEVLPVFSSGISSMAKRHNYEYLNTGARHWVPPIYYRVTKQTYFISRLMCIFS